MNPESLDSTIQSALSALFPPFEATAPTVLSQLFRTIEERYQGDALQCLLDFLIPAKHLLESVQQAACAAYSDVLFRCEGWPLCLHDRTVIQLAPLNPLLLRPGDFYLQVEPFGDQAARIVLKSLLEEGCREVEETPIPETSYPCIFTEDWLREVNDGRHSTPLSRCLLSTEQGVVKVQWVQVAVPEFLDKPKTMPTTPPVIRESPLNAKMSASDASTLAFKTIPARDGISVSLRLMEGTSKHIGMGQNKPTPKVRSKPLIKPVGWVSPNTWDSRNFREIEGDYVDLIDFAKEKETLAKLERNTKPTTPLFKPVRPPPPVPVGHSIPCGRTLRFSAEPCSPCSQRKLGQEAGGQDIKCRYRDSYLAALLNPVPFERGSVDLLSALEEISPSEGEDEGKGHSVGPCPEQGDFCNYDKESLGHCLVESQSLHHKTPEAGCQPEKSMKESLVLVHKQNHGGQQNCRVNRSLHQAELKTTLSPAPPQTNLGASEAGSKPRWSVEVMKPTGKNKAKPRSLSSVSETPKGNPLVHKLNNRSHSDICPELIPSVHVLQCKKGPGFRLISPKLERRQSPKKDSLLGKAEPQTPSTTGGLETKMQSPKTDNSSAPIHPPSYPSGASPSPFTLESCYRGISDLLQLGFTSLPGSRDKTGRAVVEVHGDRTGWSSQLISAPEVCKLLLYLHSIPRKEVRDLGMTLVIDARKKPPPSVLYKALLMVQEQALHAVHSALLLVDKDTSPRPERHPGLQMDIVTSLKALSKTVEVQQLTPDLGGTFPYSHSDWLQFHQKQVSFLSDLQGAACLLQKAINKIEDHKTMDTAQDVQQCIQEQKTSMKEVLEDARLVALQREGGSILAKMRREEFRFPQSEDYRDAIESATVLYNQVEERVHTLVMKSNQSMQHLDLLSRLRDSEGKLNTAKVWFDKEGEQWLKEFNSTDSDLKSMNKALQHAESFLSQAKEKKQQALTLVEEAEMILGSADSSPEADVFRTVINTFKSNMSGFMLQVEQKHAELENLAQLYRFCEQATALAMECRQYLELLETGCHSTKAWPSTLKNYEEQFVRKFSLQHFQAVKAKAVRPERSRRMSVWNVAWSQIQESRLRLVERLERGDVVKTQKQQPTAGYPQEKAGGSEGEETEGRREEVCRSPRTAVHTSRLSEASPRDSENLPCFNLDFKPDSQGSKEAHTPKLPKSLRSEGNLVSVSLQNGGSCPERKVRKVREHSSEVDLRRVHPSGWGDPFRWHEALVRSLSEGSCVTTASSPLSEKHAHRQLRTHSHGLCLPQQPHIFLQPSISCRESTGITEQAREGTGGCSEGTSVSSLKPVQDQSQSVLPFSGPDTEENASNVLKLQRIMKELLMTEREYVRALGYVREHYFPELERADVPQDLRGQRGIIFGNLEKLHDFHRHHFLKELEGCLKEPFRVGRCFLRHRESFGLYALYSKNKPQSDSLLISHVNGFFKQKQLHLGDKMDVSSYLLKPVQRISKYSLLLQDMVRECGLQRAREMPEVQAALEVIQFQLRHGNNLLAMDDIQDCDVNLKEQGQLIRQDEFLVSFRKKKCFRHIFLFQDLILFSKTKKTDVGNDMYIYKQSFKTSDIGMTHNSGDSGLCFEIWFRRRKTQDTYSLQANNREVKEAWAKDLERILWEQAVHNREVRMQERVFMGIGCKPFMDIQPSDAAINNRAVNSALIGRESKALVSSGAAGLQGGFPVQRPDSIGSRSSTSSSGSQSSSSSGRGSLPSTGYPCGPEQRGMAGHGGYWVPAGVLEEDDLDHESGSQNLLMDSSESSGESVSGFSSSGVSCHSTLEGEADNTVTVEEKIAHRTEDAPEHPKTSPTRPTSKKPPPVAPKPLFISKELTSCKVQNAVIGKSTEV
ncbi:quattro [Osmerus mordax]|uniref:quattro n=1 Tax=Osmerus mordax TaxID=8014 RepID=UPI0035109685